MVHPSKSSRGSSARSAINCRKVKSVLLQPDRSGKVAVGAIALVALTLWCSNFLALRSIDTQETNQQQQNEFNHRDIPMHMPHDLANMKSMVTNSKHQRSMPHASSRLSRSHNEQQQQPPQRRQAATTLQRQRRSQQINQTEEEVLKMNDGFVFHIVFSSGCNALQDWQSYAFFYEIMASGFTGNVTRVASCETDEEAEALHKLHEEQIQGPMSPKFRLHTTPDYTHLSPDEKYNFFNKPFGIRHWMQHRLKFPEQSAQFEKTIIVLMDPDQFLLRHFKRDMTEGPELWTDPNGYRIVDKGQPMGALYAFGGVWINKINTAELLSLPEVKDSASTSGLHTWTVSSMEKYYAVGPPYVVQAEDMWNIVSHWALFVVPIHHQMKGGTFMAEMYGYCTAAAHLNLPHQVSRSFMISNPDDSSYEAFSEWVDDERKASSEDLCSFTYENMPHVWHFCQRMYLGPYFFSKYQVPKSPPDEVFLSCEHPLYEEPPPNVADMYDSAVTLDGNKHMLSRRDRRRMAFGLCQVIPRMNEAATFYKQHHCTAESANYSKVFVHETHEAKKLRQAREKKS